MATGTLAIADARTLEPRHLIARLRAGEEEGIDLETQRAYAVNAALDLYGGYMYEGIRELALDQPLRIKNNLTEMGCDGGFDPIPPQQIELDESLKPLERFAALIRAAIQFYAYSGPAELKMNENPMTRWGFVHLDQTGAPNTRFYGLHQDMVRYLTEAACDTLGMGAQTWMQRGDSAHVRQLAANPAIGEDLLLRAYFNEAFPELVSALNRAGIGDVMAALSELSDYIDNARLCEFPEAGIVDYEARYARAVLAVDG